jgi:hypothetical protein
MIHGTMDKIVTLCLNEIQLNDTQHNDTQHNDTQHNDTQHNDTQHNDTQHNDTQKCTAQIIDSLRCAPAFLNNSRVD